MKDVRSKWVACKIWPTQTKQITLENQTHNTILTDWDLNIEKIEQKLISWD